MAQLALLHYLWREEVKDMTEHPTIQHIDDLVAVAVVGCHLLKGCLRQFNQVLDGQQLLLLQVAAVLQLLRIDPDCSHQQYTDQENDGVND